MAGNVDVKQCNVCGKYYDVNVYDKCPFCESGKVAPNDKEEKMKTEKNGRLSDLLRGKNKKTINITSNVTNVIKDENNKEEEEFKTVMELVEEDDVIVNDSQQIVPITPSSSIMEKPKERSEIYDNNEMKTVQMFVSTKISEEKTTAQVQQSSNKAPVIGWLVGIKGKYQGRSFELCAGNNKIGRDCKNDIVIDESSVSREQATIKYEPRKRKFHLIPNDAATFMYINNEEVIERTFLEDYMHIEIGEQLEFVFVSFCGDKFDWNDNTSDKEN